MSEVIGVGPLELGVLGINISEDNIRKLVGEALSFHPLGRIFHLDEKIRITDNDIDILIGSINIYECNDSVDQLIILSKMNRSEYDLENGLVYSELSHIEFAHELGHALGLEHPVKRCHEGICTLKYMQHICPYSRDIMGCTVNQTETFGFTKEDIKKLEEGYLI